MAVLTTLLDILEKAGILEDFLDMDAVADPEQFKANLISEVQTAETVISGGGTSHWEYRTLWVEEGGTLRAGSWQWSWGNGATGGTGLPLGDGGWFLREMFVQADAASAGATIAVSVRDLKSGVNDTQQGDEIYTITASVAQGDGLTNNLYKLDRVNVKIDDGAVIVFRTERASNGVVSDARVGVTVRRWVEE